MCVCVCFVLFCFVLFCFVFVCLFVVTDFVLLLACFSDCKFFSSERSGQKSKWRLEQKLVRRKLSVLGCFFSLLES